MTELTHFDESGASRMVDVTGKEVTLRTARASGRVRLQPSTLALVRDRRMAKGDVLEVARLAGIMAAKRTGELIPLCHPLGHGQRRASLFPIEPDAIRIEANVKVHGRTGVEMEALTAVSVAALTVYDMCKSVDRGMMIGQIQLEEKTGGRRGTFRRAEAAGGPAPCEPSAARAKGGQPAHSWDDGEISDVVTTVARARRSPAQPVVACTRPIAAELAEAERIFQDELGSRFPFVQQLVDHCADFQGKRLRPALVLLSGQACGSLSDDHPVLAAVVEMIHTATLVHDDVLDEAMIRRHAATVNAEWGNETAVLLGDYLFTHAFHLAASLESTRACRWIGHATNKVCEGEMQQVHHRGNLDLDEGDYFAIIEGKTAELTAVSCRLGASYAGASRIDRGRARPLRPQPGHRLPDRRRRARYLGRRAAHRQEPGNRPGEAEADSPGDQAAPPGRSRVRGDDPRSALGRESRSAPPAAAASGRVRRPRLRLAARQAACQAGPRRARLPGRFRGHERRCARWRNT